MDIYQIVAVGIVSSILSITIKREAPTFSLLISLSASILIFFMILPKLSVTLRMLIDISENITTSIPYVLIVMKIIGVAYICEFGSQICIDAGESSIASKIELAGKVVIMTLSIPIVVALIQQIISLTS